MSLRRRRIDPSQATRDGTCCTPFARARLPLWPGTSVLRRWAAGRSRSTSDSRPCGSLRQPSSRGGGPSAKLAVGRPRLPRETGLLRGFQLLLSRTDDLAVQGARTAVVAGSGEPNEAVAARPQLELSVRADVADVPTRSGLAFGGARRVSRTSDLSMPPACRRTRPFTSAPS